MWRRAGSAPNHIKALRVWGHINGETTNASGSCLRYGRSAAARDKDEQCGLEAASGQFGVSCEPIAPVLSGCAVIGHDASADLPASERRGAPGHSWARRSSECALRRPSATIYRPPEWGHACAVEVRLSPHSALPAFACESSAAEP